jgi:hypothetical protein
LHGKDTVLNLEFKRALVELCGTCTLTFTNITISNERRGTGSVYDLFLGLPGSKIIAYDIYKLRIACTSAHHLAQVTSRTKRSSILPGEDKPQEFEFVNATFNVSTACAQQLAIRAALCAALNQLLCAQQTAEISVARVRDEYTVT